MMVPSPASHLQEGFTSCGCIQTPKVAVLCCRSILEVFATVNQPYTQTEHSA